MQRERNPIYRTRPTPRAARRIWDSLVTAGHKVDHLVFEDIGSALEMCGPSGGWFYRSDLGAGPLGYSADEALEHIAKGWK